MRLFFWMPKENMKGKCYVFSGHKKRNNISWMYLECKLEQDSWFINFQLKMPENGKKNTSRDKQTTTKVALMFFDDKLLTER